VAVGDEDVTVVADRHVGRPVESIGPFAGDAGLAERQQNLAVRVEFEYLMAAALGRKAEDACLVVGIGDPNVAVAVDMETVRECEQALAKAFEQFGRKGRIS